MFKGHIVTGTVTATGAAMNVELGFKPSRVEILNETTHLALLWTDTMAAGKGRKTAAAGTASFVGSNGITPYDGARGDKSAGFTLGTDSVNTTSNVLHYTAWGSE